MFVKETPDRKKKKKKRTGLYQGDLLENFKENNLAKVNCSKLETQEKPSRMF